MGILYTTDDLMCRAIQICFEQAQIKLYDFKDLLELDGQLKEFGARFIILDTDKIPLSTHQRGLLEQAPVPIFCLGEDIGIGQWVAKPCNPRVLLERVGYLTPLF